jgi:hypothetical protein
VKTDDRLWRRRPLRWPLLLRWLSLLRGRLGLRYDAVVLPFSYHVIDLVVRIAVVDILLPPTLSIHHLLPQRKIDDVISPHSLP